MLTAYHYPGNIRELKSILHAAANLSQGGSITPGHLPDTVRNRKPSSGSATLSNSGTGVVLSENEKAHILSVYRQMDENKSRTARILGIGINTLRRKLMSYAIK